MRYELSLPRRYNADGALTVSDTLADYFANAGYVRERILPIYYGFDSTLFPFRTPTHWDGRCAPLIVMHGSLDYHHLRDIALIAFERFLRDIPKRDLSFCRASDRSARGVSRARQGEDSECAHRMHWLCSLY
jgi:hypothetical protein